MTTILSLTTLTTKLYYMKKDNFELLRRFVGNMPELRKIAKALHSNDEAICNYGDSTRRDNKEKKLMERAGVIAEWFGLFPYHQGDPRGGSLYLVDSLDKMDTSYTNGIYIDY